MVTTTQMIMVMKLWLENKKAYKRFLKKVEKQWGLMEDPEHYFEVAADDAESLISGAFVWNRNTDYWVALDKEWRKFYNEFMEIYE